MKNLGIICLSLLISLAPVFAAETLTIVSDVDATLKIIDTSSVRSLIVDGLYGQKAFLGMSQLFHEWFIENPAHPKPTSFLYLSRSPQFLVSHLDPFIFDDHSYPFGRLKLFKVSDLWTMKDYKIRNIKKLLKDMDRSLILIGDDTESDASDFEQFCHLDRVKACYIHRVKGKNLPAEMTPFVTAFDLALHEVEAGRLLPEQAVAIGEFIIDADRPDLLFPEFKHCPKDFDYHGGDSGTFGLGPISSGDNTLIGIALKMKAYIQYYCNHKNSSPYVQG